MLLGGYTPLLPLSHTIAWQHRLQNIILRLHLRRPRRFPNELSAFGSDERPKQSRVRWSSMDWLIELRFYVPLDTKWVTSDTWKRWLLPIVNDSCILHPCSACNRRTINFYMMMMMMMMKDRNKVEYGGLPGIDWLIDWVKVLRPTHSTQWVISETFFPRYLFLKAPRRRLYQNQLCPSSRFNRIPTCDRQRQIHTQATPYAALA